MKNIVPVIVGIAAIVSAIGTAIANANGLLAGHAHWVPMLYALFAVLFVAALVIGIYNSQREASQAPNPPRNSIPIEYGFREEWGAFAARHVEFTRRFENLSKAIDTAFQRTHQTSTMMERTVYFLGRLAVEELMEILLLAANGYGIGAQKPVRGMYERAVTARYLYKFPDEVESYRAFHRVTDHKFLMAIHSTMGDDVFSPERTKQIEQDFKAVKDRFMIPDCKTCKTTRLNHTWSKVDIVSMARMSDENLWRLIVPAYYQPTQEAHSTLGAIFSRLDDNAVASGEGLIFDGAAQRDRADGALIAAQNILLNVLDLQRECFHIQELEPLMQTCLEDFIAILKEQKERDKGGDVQQANSSGST